VDEALALGAKGDVEPEVADGLERIEGFCDLQEGNAFRALLDALRGADNPLQQALEHCDAAPSRSSDPRRCGASRTTKEAWKIPQWEHASLQKIHRLHTSMARSVRCCVLRYLMKDGGSRRVPKVKGGAVVGEKGEWGTTAPLAGYLSLGINTRRLAADGRHHTCRNRQARRHEVASRCITRLRDWFLDQALAQCAEMGGPRNHASTISFRPGARFRRWPTMTAQEGH
jgi:hypothetical protein